MQFVFFGNDIKKKGNLAVWAEKETMSPSYGRTEYNWRNWKRKFERERGAAIKISSTFLHVSGLDIDMRSELTFS